MNEVNKELIKRNETLVSVIVPIYNVAPYIDRCVESIVNQTYCNLEILLINDGSTDESLRKCHEWRKEDDRIIVVDKKNEGLGPVRNYGIHIARGEYIISVDSDDWVDLHYVEKLLFAAQKHNADVAICNISFFAQESEEYTTGRSIIGNGIIETIEDKIEFMHRYPAPAFFAKIYRRKMLINNQIFQPNTTAQDLAVIVQVIACANMIVLIDDVLYYYWSDRKTSITNSTNKSKDFLRVFRYSVTEMKRLELFDIYKIGQLAILASHASVMLKNYKGAKDYYELEKDYRNLLDEEFTGWENIVWDKWLVYGSFNAAWTAQSYSQSYICTSKHYCFTSLISCFLGNKAHQYQTLHNNKIRERAVNSDIMGINMPIELQDEVGILIDFMEERNDILETEDGVYIADSEAFRECSNAEIRVKRVISSGSTEYMELWKEACLKFIQWLDNRTKEVPIYLLQMRMAKGYGLGKVEEMFGNQEEIDAVNVMLDEMDTFFLKHCKDAVYVRGTKELYYSQIAQTYGCEPCHLNWQLYREMSKKIMSEEKGAQG